MMHVLSSVKDRVERIGREVGGRKLLWKWWCQSIPVCVQDVRL